MSPKRQLHVTSETIAQITFIKYLENIVKDRTSEEKIHGHENKLQKLI